MLDPGYSGESRTMLSHASIWDAIDALATRKGLSASGLARAAGLDPTIFNPSKRIGTNGKPRWPSTESLAKVLNATDTAWEDFLAQDRTGGFPPGATAVALDPALRPAQDRLAAPVFGAAQRALER